MPKRPRSSGKLPWVKLELDQCERITTDDFKKITFVPGPKAQGWKSRDDGRTFVMAERGVVHVLQEGRSVCTQYRTWRREQGLQVKNPELWKRGYKLYLFEGLQADRDDAYQSPWSDQFESDSNDQNRGPKIKAGEEEEKKDFTGDNLEDWLEVQDLSAKTSVLLQDAVTELRSLPLACWLKTAPRGVMQSKRTQLTIGFAYPFTGLRNNPGISYDRVPAVQRFVAEAANQHGLPIERVMMHVNLYPEETTSGIPWHRDDEPVIDQTFPIIGYSVGGPAVLNLAFGGPGAESLGPDRLQFQHKPSQCYAMKAGFQDVGSHRVTRTKKGEKSSVRISLTLRVVKPGTKPSANMQCY